MRMTFVLAIALLAVTGCESSDEAYGRGFTDGYAVGFNTACAIRATTIHGDWDNADYARGYSDGQTSGIVDCNAQRRGEDSD